MMNPAGTLERGIGSPDSATGTRATSGGVKPPRVRRRVEFYEIVENGYISATLTAVRLRLREQFRLCASPLDQRLCQRQYLNDRRSQRVTTSGGKDLSQLRRTMSPCSHRFNVRARMLSCKTACLSVKSSSMEYELTVKESQPDAAGRPGVQPGWRAPTCPRKVLQVIPSTKDPVVSLRHRASPCPLTGSPQSAPARPFLRRTRLRGRR